MSAIDFLKEKGILKDGYTKFVITFDNGNKVDVVDLLNEWASEDVKEKAWMYDELNK